MANSLGEQLISFLRGQFDLDATFIVLIVIDVMAYSRSSWECSSQLDLLLKWSILTKAMDVQKKRNPFEYYSNFRFWHFYCSHDVPQRRSPTSIGPRPTFYHYKNPVLRHFPLSWVLRTKKKKIATDLWKRRNLQDVRLKSKERESDGRKWMLQTVCGTEVAPFLKTIYQQSSVLDERVQWRV